MTSIATPQTQKRSEAVAQKSRRISIVPTLSAETAQQLDRLSAEERELLDRLLAEPLEYVDHPSYHTPEAEGWRYADAPALAETPGAVSDRSGRALLAADQETELFLAYNFARLRQVELLTRYADRQIPLDELRELAAWAGRAAAIRARIVELNMPLVMAMARRTRLADLDVNELASEGNFALLRSVDKFDCGRGFKFSTYACRAILKSFSRVMMRVSRYRSHFPVEFEPTLERSDHLSRVRDHQEEDAIEQISTILAENRAELTDMERQVIAERFALFPSTAVRPVKTLQEVGAQIGVTKERVRQIQNRALRKLRTALEVDLWG